MTRGSKPKRKRKQITRKPRTRRTPRVRKNAVAVNAEFKREVATQHAPIESLRKTVALEKSRADRATAAERGGRKTAPGRNDGVGLGFVAVVEYGRKRRNARQPVSA